MLCVFLILSHYGSQRQAFARVHSTHPSPRVIMSLHELQGVERSQATGWLCGFAFCFGTTMGNNVKYVQASVRHELLHLKTDAQC